MNSSTGVRSTSISPRIQRAALKKLAEVTGELCELLERRSGLNYFLLVMGKTVTPCSKAAEKVHKRQHCRASSRFAVSSMSYFLLVMGTDGNILLQGRRESAQKTILPCEPSVCCLIYDLLFTSHG